MSNSGNNVVYVGRLTNRTRKEDLEDVFARCGRVVRLDLKDNYGFVEFSDPLDAQEACKKLDGTEVNGSRILVEPSRRGEGRCFSCGKEGHWARDCREGRGSDRDRGRDRGGRDSRGGGSSGGSRGCYNCGELGHFARDCRSSRRSSGGGRYSERYHPYRRSSRRSRTPSPRGRRRRSTPSLSPRRRSPDSRSPRGRKGSRDSHSPSPKRDRRSTHTPSPDRRRTKSRDRDNRSPSLSPAKKRTPSPNPSKRESSPKNDRAEDGGRDDGTKMEQ